MAAVVTVGGVEGSGGSKVTVGGVGGSGGSSDCRRSGGKWRQ